MANPEQKLHPFEDVLRYRLGRRRCILTLESLERSAVMIDLWNAFEI